MPGFQYPGFQVPGFQSVITPIVVEIPTSEQITLEEARLHLRIDAYGSPAIHPDDSWIRENLATAREYCEEFMARSLAAQTFEIALDHFPCDEIALPMASPLISIESVTYVDTDGTDQTMASNLYATDLYQMPGWLLPAYGERWPSTRCVINAVKVRYRAGYSLRGDSPELRPMPATFRSVMKLVLTDLYVTRGNSTDQQRYTVPIGAQNLMMPYRLELGV